MLRAPSPRRVAAVEERIRAVDVLAGNKGLAKQEVLDRHGARCGDILGRKYGNRLRIGNVFAAEQRPGDDDFLQPVVVGLLGGRESRSQGGEKNEGWLRDDGASLEHCCSP